VTSKTRPVRKSTPSRHPPPRQWRVVDIVVASVVAVACGVIFWAWGLAWNALSLPLAFLPGLSGLLAGGWLFAGVLGALIIRKPGAALFTELVAAFVSMAIGTEWGWATLVSGLIQGAAIELVFLVFLYTNWSIVRRCSPALPGAQLSESTRTWSITPRTMRCSRPSTCHRPSFLASCLPDCSAGQRFAGSRRLVRSAVSLPDASRANESDDWCTGERARLGVALRRPPRLGRLRRSRCRSNPARRVLLLGASGAGKSTVLQALAGVLGGDDEGDQQGELLIDGRRPADARGLAGLVLQDPDSQVVLARVGDDVAFGCENLGLPTG
jgi:ABC-type multidrug transport system fused ATPase/permease subunit